MSKDFDLIVIGAGPGGYVAAIRAAQLGMKVACVDKRETLGGTCLNVGCIPSKALLHSSQNFYSAVSEFEDQGIEISGVNINLKKMMKHKDEVVENLTKGIDYLFKKNKVTRLTGTGYIPQAGSVKVTSGTGKNAKDTLYSCDKILIATGSEPVSLPGIDIDEKQIVSSTGALELTKIPKKMIVIGAGVIGLELGSVWARLGTEVEVVEYLERITPAMDKQVSKEFQKILTKQGLKFHMQKKVTGAKTSKAGVELTVEAADDKDQKGGKPEKMKADVVLMSIGRRPYTDDLGLDKAGVETNDRGFITVDDHFQTNVEGIYAIGDVILGPMLAHKAEEDGVTAVEIMAGQAGHIDYNLVPSIVYTHPEVASIGRSEEQLKDEGIEYKAGSFPMMANSRARANNEPDGFVKILADAKTDAVLGAHIIGPEAGNLIQEVANVMAFHGSAEDLARICHGHPTYNEAVKEAALAVDKRAVHV